MNERTPLAVSRQRASLLARFFVDVLAKRANNFTLWISGVIIASVHGHYYYDKNGSNKTENNHDCCAKKITKKKKTHVARV